MSEVTSSSGSGAMDWNGEAGRIWVTMQERIDRQLARLGKRAIAALELRDGMRVMDIGCGGGATTLAMAEAMPAGHVTGVDVSAPLLELARARAKQAGAANVRFELGDAAHFAFERQGYDALFSRFGVMFFAQPVAAFRNMRAGLKAGARLSFLCWRPLAENAYLLVPLMAAFRHLTPSAPPPPGAPGQFAFADAGTVRGVLGEVGFAGIEVAPVDDMMGGGSMDETMELLFALGPLRLAMEAAPEPAREAATLAVRDALAPYDGPDGVQLGCAAWLVIARA